MKLLSKKIKKRLKKHLLALPKTLAIATAISKIIAVFYLLIEKVIGC